jgi:hypothetical protein
MYCQSVLQSSAKVRIALEVNAVPLSLTTVASLPREPNRVSRSRATLAPDWDVSAIRARHSRVQSSTTVNTRKRRPSVSWSETKSSNQRWFGHERQHHWSPRAGSPHAPAPAAHLQPLLAVVAEQAHVVHLVTLAAPEDKQPPMPNRWGSRARSFGGSRNTGSSCRTASYRIVALQQSITRHARRSLIP